MALNLITRQEYKTYAGIKSTNQDAEIDALIPRVSEFVKTYCRRTFVDYMDTPKVEVFPGGTDYFLLQETPVVSVASVEYSEDYGQTYIPLVQYVDWVDDGEKILSTLSTGFPKKIRGYKVTYTAGYEDVPYDLALAVMDLVTYYLRHDGGIHNHKVPGGGGSVQLEYIVGTNTVPAHIRRVLDMNAANYN